MKPILLPYTLNNSTAATTAVIRVAVVRSHGGLGRDDQVEGGGVNLEVLSGAHELLDDLSLHAAVSGDGPGQLRLRQALVQQVRGDGRAHHVVAALHDEGGDVPDLGQVLLLQQKVIPVLEIVAVVVDREISVV